MSRWTKFLMSVSAPFRVIYACFAYVRTRRLLRHDLVPPNIATIDLPLLDDYENIVRNELRGEAVMLA